MLNQLNEANAELAILAVMLLGGVILWTWLRPVKRDFEEAIENRVKQQMKLDQLEISVKQLKDQQVSISNLEHEMKNRRETTIKIFEKLEELQEASQKAHTAINEKIHKIEIDIANLNTTGCKPIGKVEL